MSASPARKKSEELPSGERASVPRFFSAHPMALAWLLGTVAALWMGARKFLPLVTGLADQTDQLRYLCQLGMLPDAELERWHSYAILDWHQSQDASAQCDRSKAAIYPYPSIQVWFLRLAASTTQLVTGVQGSLDLRPLILLYCLVTGIVVGFFVYALRRRFLASAIAASLLWLVLADGTFSNYAGSAYGEFPGLLGVALLSIGAVWSRLSGSKQWLGYILVAAGGILAVTSKMQGVTIAVPVAIFLLSSGVRRRHSGVRAASRTPAWVTGVVSRIVPAVLVLAIMTPAGWMLANNPKQFQAINAWELISVGILAHSSDPASDLREMGFPEELAKYAGKTAGDENSIMNTPDWAANQDKMNYATVLQLLLRHPDKGILIANNAAKDFLTTRPSYLGSYTQDSGQKPGAQDFSFLTLLMKDFIGGGLVILTFGWMNLLLLAVLLKRQAPHASARRAFASAAVLLLAIAITQYLTAGFGEAIENTKHMVYGIFAGALAPVFIIGAILARNDEGLETTSQGSSRAGE